MKKNYSICVGAENENYDSESFERFSTNNKNEALIFYSHAQECKAILIALKKHRGYLMEYLRKKNANACIEADRAKKCNDNIMSFYWLGVAQAAKDLAQLITYHEEGDF